MRRNAIDMAIAFHTVTSCNLRDEPLQIERENPHDQRKISGHKKCPRINKNKNKNEKKKRTHTQFEPHEKKEKLKKHGHNIHNHQAINRK